ncbi:hypothetical protein GDO86_014106 [Hymenochirus boettgeri]|uniref:Coiled-coil domain-containing protein 40 n=1 Tax=Hymenochirus boettgeri TaxID=247094 RepID=A0A8T2JVM1_9PIPI|nr:hypothetical protein GDO86_014106 [Hymenochirus boettgeri]
MGLEKQHDKHNQVSALAIKEKELEAIRKIGRESGLRLSYMENANEDLRSDVTVMKRAVQKVEKDKRQAEVEKQKQDMFVGRLTRELDRLREQIALYEAQVSAQREDTKAAREAISEVGSPHGIDAIGVEKKQLLQAVEQHLIVWPSGALSMETEIEGYNKAIRKEEDKNEQLTFMLNRAESDTAMSKKLVAQCLARQEALRVEYSTYVCTLQETEQALNRVTVERAGYLNEITAIQKQIEKESHLKLNLETQILAKLKEKMTSDKAAKYSSLLAAKLQKQKLELEINCSKVENETAQVSLKTNQSLSRIQVLQKSLAELEKDIQNTDDLMSQSQNEITKRTLAIERKQATINLFSKQIEATLEQIGGKDMGPLEIQINALTKQIDECTSEIMSVQQYCLRLQTEMVRLTQQREEQNASVEMLKKELTIHQQKKIRTENEIEQEMKEQKDIEHHMKSLKNDIVRLNVLLSKKSTTKEQLQQNNQLMESEFMQSLREAEKESIEMQENLRHLEEEKERLLLNLVEAEQQNMLWEKKIQLAKEMRNAVDSEMGQGEIQAMKAEIHRMQLRYNQLMKQQEKMIKDLEATVTRRETITWRAQGQSEKNKKQLTVSDLRRKKQELRKKIKEIQKNTEECDGTIADLENTRKSLTSTIAEKQHNVSTMKENVSSMEAEVEQLQEKKRLNLTQIVSYQTRVKHLQAVKDGKYKPICSSLEALKAEEQKQESRIHTISTIIHQIQQEYPQYQSDLRCISLALEAHAGHQNEHTINKQ